MANKAATGNWKSKTIFERRPVRQAGDQERRPEPRTDMTYNEGGTCRPHCLAKMMSASTLSSNHRNDSERAGIHDEDLVADQDVFIAAILRGIFHDRNRQDVKMHCSWNSFADPG